MRPVVRLLLAAAFASAPVAFAIVSCGTDAENIDACRQIEGARCELAPACAAGFDVDSCTRFYREACLVGTANVDAGDVSALVNPCIDALKACAAADAPADLGCPGQALAASDAGALCKDLDGRALDPTPCNIVMQCPEALAACAWIAKPPSAGTGGSDAGSGGDGSTGGGGTGGGATTGSGGKASGGGGATGGSG